MTALPVVAIVGTVGVPARYGGFETLAEQLARRIAPARARLILYCQRSAYPDKSGPFAGHRRVMLPLRANGPASMVHDMLALLHAAFVARVSVCLVLGVSGAWLLPVLRVLRPGMRLVTNIDGMEWRRDKFGPAAKAVLRALEWLAVRASHAVIADNAALVTIARERYRVEPVMIAYGGDHTLVPPVSADGDPEPGYWLAVARVEPENNAAMLLSACAEAGARFVFVGNWHANGYARDLHARFAGTPGLRLLDPIYDVARLAALRAGAIGYLHGHSVGGTNPSLVEALFHTRRVLAFDCVFNRATLGGAGGFFADAEGLRAQLGNDEAGVLAEHDALALRGRYRWATVTGQYAALMGIGETA